MSFEHIGTSVDYDPVTYPGSALRFRGPAQDLSAPFILCLGGSDVFGRCIETPFVALLNQALPLPVANMGVVNGGLDVILQDPAICAATARAKAIILQVPGAANMSNRFYTVHPRRNDRFLKASAVLRTIYPDIDFTEYHFTKHLLSALCARSPDRFALVRQELQTAWSARMMGFLAGCAAPVHLLWFSLRVPGQNSGAPDLSREPVLVTQPMLDRVAPHAASLTTIVARSGHIHDAQPYQAAGTAPVGSAIPGIGAHRTVADSLALQLA